MVAPERSEMRVFGDAVDTHSGYVLDFSDRNRTLHYGIEKSTNYPYNMNNN
jgi:hypothetical protein